MRNKTLLEFASVTVSFFVHSTEDSDSLLSIISEKLGLAPEELHTEGVEGYYGNTIISVKAHVTGRKAQEIALGTLRNLSRSASQQILSELDKSMDEHDALYLRIDRQSINREIALSDEEPIRVKLKPKYRFGGHNSMKESYEELIR